MRPHYEEKKWDDDDDGSSADRVEHVAVWLLCIETALCVAAAVRAVRPWSVRLTVCLRGAGLSGFLCPCVQAARNKAAIDGRDMTACDVLCLPSEFFTRQQLRGLHHMGTSHAADCAAVCCCY